MVGWIIFGSILLLFCILLSLSITFRVWYDDDLTITVGVGKFRYTLLPVSDEEEKDVKKGSKAAKKGIQKEQKKANPKAEKKIEKGDIKETVFLVLDIIKSVWLPFKDLMKRVRITALSIDITVGGEDAAETGDIKETVFLVLDIIKSVWLPFKDLMKRVRITALSIDITVGGEDAAETAVLYGKISAFVYGGLAALRNLMTVKVNRVAITCNFLQDHTEQTVFFKVKIRILSAIWAGLRMGWGILVNTFQRARENAVAKQENIHREPEGISAKGGSAAGDSRRN